MTGKGWRLPSSSEGQLYQTFYLYTSITLIIMKKSYNLLLLKSPKRLLQIFSPPISWGRREEWTKI